jgi:hypothetical protein
LQRYYINIYKNTIIKINGERKEKSTQFQEYFLEVGSLTKGSHDPEFTDDTEIGRVVTKYSLPAIFFLIINPVLINEKAGLAHTLKKGIIGWLRALLSSCHSQSFPSQDREREKSGSAPGPPNFFSISYPCLSAFIGG